jgi:hypothetical protein
MAKKNKNKRRKSEDIVLRSPEDVEAPESAPEKAPEKVAPTGQEPVGMKERVKRGFLTERDALTLLEESPTTVTPHIVGWLRRRL